MRRIEHVRKTENSTSLELKAFFLGLIRMLLCCCYYYYYCYYYNDYDYDYDYDYYDYYYYYHYYYYYKKPGRFIARRFGVIMTPLSRDWLNSMQIRKGTR